MIDPKAYIKAMQHQPQQFDEIICVAGDIQIERVNNGTYTLWRENTLLTPGTARRWEYIGGVDRADIRGNFEASITKPLDTSDDSDIRVVYLGPNLDDALEALWQHRHEAY